MEDTREQQPRPPVAPPAGQSAPEPHSGPYYGYALATSASPSYLEIAERLLRLLSRRLLRALYLLWQLIKPRLGWVVLTSFLLGTILFLGALLLLPRLIASVPAADNRAALIPPAPAVVNFLRGQQTYDADLMWESFSPELQTALEEREITRDALAQQAETERQAGQRYRDAEYIGGVQLDGRQQMYFYAVDIDSPQPERSGTFSMIFTVDGDGKIVSVRM
jgi:hypothetical protein